MLMSNSSAIWHHNSTTWHHNDNGQYWKTCTGQYGILSQYALCTIIEGHVTSNWPIGFEYLQLTCSKGQYCTISVQHHETQGKDWYIVSNFKMNIAIKSINYYKIYFEWSTKWLIKKYIYF